MSGYTHDSFGNKLPTYAEWFAGHRDIAAENRKLTAELAEAKETIELYRRNCANVCLPDRDDEHEARVRIAQGLLDNIERARHEEAKLNCAHPLTADRFSQVLDAD